LANITGQATKYLHFMLTQTQSILIMINAEIISNQF